MYPFTSSVGCPAEILPSADVTEFARHGTNPAILVPTLDRPLRAAFFKDSALCVALAIPCVTAELPDNTLVTWLDAVVAAPLTSSKKLML